MLILSLIDQLFLNYQRYTVQLLSAIKLGYLQVDSYTSRRCISLINICVVLSFLSHFVTSNLISFMPHLLLDMLASIKPYTVLVFVYFGLECVLILKNGSSNILTVCLHIDGNGVIKTPFAVLLVGLWMFSHHTDSNSNIGLMNTMYRMNQIVVVVPVSD